MVGAWTLLFLNTSVRISIISQVSPMIQDIGKASVIVAAVWACQHCYPRSSRPNSASPKHSIIVLKKNKTVLE